VLINWKLMFALAAASGLVACGGGGDTSARGAIAVNTSNGYGAVVVNYTSRAEASSDAVDKCARASGAGCITVLEFSDNGTCGSAAWSGNDKIWGVASAGSKEEADSRAVSRCISKGGTSCEVPDWLETQCN
jgi:7-cyano-7-deazaguanine synthase in queuosine biosynthesis